MNTRDAAVAGMFYPSSRSELSKMLGSLFSEAEKKNLQGDSEVIVAPHAGYVYSGKVAAAAFCSFCKADTYIILSPNHTGLGSTVSIFPPGEWKTPLGTVDVDDALCSAIAESLNTERDDLAHISEHAAEVQVPFLQYRFKDFKIAPITIAEHGFEELKKLSGALVKAAAEVKKSGIGVALIASSDFSHFVHEEKARREDIAAIRYIEALDTKGFYREVVQKSLSICGFAPIVVAMGYAKECGAKHAELIAYDTSASASGNRASVVGYAAIAFKR